MRQLVLPRTQPVADLALSPDGQTLAVAQRGGLLLCDPFDGRVKLEFRGNYSRLQFREDGRWLLAANPGAVVVSFEGDRPREIHVHSNEYIHHGRFGLDETITLHCSQSRRTLRLPNEGETYGYDIHAYEINWNAFPRPDPTHVFYCFGLIDEHIHIGFEMRVRGEDFVLVIVDRSKGRLIARVDSPNQFIFNPNGPHFRQSADWLALSSNRELTICNGSDLGSLVAPTREPRRRSLLETVRETLLGPSAATLHDQRYGHLPTLRPRHRLPAVGTPPVDPLPVAFLPDGSAFLCRGAGATVELRDTATGRVRTSWQFQRAWPRVLAVAPDGLTAMAAVRGGTVVFWDLE
jgi:hypothetical protein